MRHLISIVRRLLFLGAVFLAGLAIWEKLANMRGMTLLQSAVNPSRIFEYSGIVLLFVIVLQLWDIKTSLGRPGS
jgi:hypothetical protein